MQKRYLQKAFTLLRTLLRKNPVGAQRGFTLIELLTVIGVIATLATVLMVIINPAEMNRRTNDSRRLSDMSMLKTAIDLAIADKQSPPYYPDTDGVFKPLGSIYDIDGKGFKIDKYLSSIPVDPAYGNTKGLVFNLSNECVLGTITGTMQYQISGDGNQYTLRSFMQSTVNCDKVINDGLNNAVYELSKIP